MPAADQEGKKPPPRDERRSPADEAGISKLIREKTGSTHRAHRGQDHTVFSDDPTLDLRAFSRHLEQVLLKLRETLGHGLDDDEPSLPVIHFKEEAGYRRFCKAIGLEKYAVEGFGCYAPGLSFRPIVLQGLMLGTLRHEATHQFVERAMGPGVREVPWVSEGLGALFEAYPPEEFTRFRRYRLGRKRILDPAFSLEVFAKRRKRSEGIYDVGATIHGVLLLGKDPSKYRKWLGDLAGRKCGPQDLPRYLGRSWKELEGELRRYCKQMGTGTN